MDNGLGALKTQITTMFMMNRGNNNNKGNNNNSDIFALIYTMVFMNLIEVIFKQLPVIGTTAKAMAIMYWNRKKNTLPLLANSITNADGSKKTETIYSITLQRHFYKPGSTKGTANATAGTPAAINIDKIDSVIEHLCSLSNVKNVKMGARYSLNSVDEIELTPLLKAKVRETGDLDGEDADGLIEVVIFSTILKIPEIRKWIDEIHSNYIFEKNNKLGNGIYYFNEVPSEPPFNFDPDDKDKTKRLYRWDNAPKMLMFQMTEFRTSKSFSNIYGNHVGEMKERLDLFVNHPEWYIERGIPHSLGILLHGVPGGGKTSTIKAIAKDTNRHIFNISLRKYTTQQQLTNLFFNDTVGIFREGSKESLRIPLNRRVYVIEDIDCLTDVVWDREFYPRVIENSGDAVTLSFLLNLLDGVLETPGRILIITSNFPEKLDRAFIRPGRIDVKIEFSYTDRAFILDMLNKFYDISWELSEIPEALEGVFTPAEVMESMCTYFKDPKKAVEHMVKKYNVKEAAEDKKFAAIMQKSVCSVEPVTNPVRVMQQQQSMSQTNPLEDQKEETAPTDLGTIEKKRDNELQDIALKSKEDFDAMIKDIRTRHPVATDDVKAESSQKDMKNTLYEQAVSKGSVQLTPQSDALKAIERSNPSISRHKYNENIIPLSEQTTHMSFEAAYDNDMLGANPKTTFEEMFQLPGYEDNLFLKTLQQTQKVENTVF